MDKFARSKMWTVIKTKDAFLYLFPEIKEMFYFVDPLTQEEYVRLSCNNAKVGYYHVDINVTDNSVEALFDNVWRKCKEVFL